MGNWGHFPGHLSRTNWHGYRPIHLSLSRSETADQVQVHGLCCGLMTLFRLIFHPEPAWSSHTVSPWPALDMLDFSPHGIAFVSSNILWLSSENCEMRVVLATKGFRLGAWKLKAQTTDSFPLWLSQFTIQLSSVTCFYLKLIRHWVYMNCFM